MTAEGGVPRLGDEQLGPLSDGLEDLEPDHRMRGDEVRSHNQHGSCLRDIRHFEIRRKLEPPSERQVPELRDEGWSGERSDDPRSQTLPRESIKDMDVFDGGTGGRQNGDLVSLVGLEPLRRRVEGLFP